MRFTEVPPPLEARVQQGLMSRFRQAVGIGVSLQHRLNETVHDQELTDRTTNAIVDALRPGTLPFALLVLLALSLAAHALLVRRGADRILRQHGHFLRDNEDNGRCRPHAD
tara:strand:+ start:3235 stop:3567 length:333 start_codon:yes stop_codon:yes gene_type:complete